MTSLAITQLFILLFILLPDMIVIVLSFVIPYKIGKISQSETLFKNFMIACVVCIIWSFILTIMGNPYHIPKKELLQALGILACAYLTHLYFLYKFLKELAFITQDRLFVIAFIGFFVFYPIGFVIYLVALCRIKHICKSSSA